jgi:subtilase family serine protease
LSISMAPGISRLIVYEAPNCCYYWVDILKQMQEDDSAKQISCSWLFDYDDPNADTIYQEFILQGQSFFQCSGDYLAFYNGVSQWTDDPYVTLVGGTMLTTTNNGAWFSEAVWKNDSKNGSGGGVSASYLGNVPIPAWQQGVNNAANDGSATMRNVPDVALLAYDGWVISDNGSTDWWWGTSLAAPLWAGYMALINQQAAACSEPPLGFLNPIIYGIGGSSLYASCFHDITTGNNTNKNSANVYFAVPGYDLCTGWGSPGPNLINVLTELPGLYNVTHNPNGSVTLFSLSVPGSTNMVLSTTNLSAHPVWQTISTNIAGVGGTWQFTDTNAVKYKARFYRILSY